MKRFTILALSVFLVVGFTACSAFNDERGKGDAPLQERHEDPRQVWENLDGFPNISAFCIGANGVYTTTREAAPAVILDDPNCTEGGILIP